MPDYAGYSFGPAGDEDKIAVWIGSDGAPEDVAGTFTEWFNAEMDRHEQHIAEFDDAKVAELRMAYGKGVEEPRMAGIDPDDPYCLLGYSLGGSYDQAAYTTEDLDLFWVGPGVCCGVHGVYGLIDRSGTWRIPYGTKFRAVRPFRDGVAEVIVASKGTSDTGPRTRIRPDGSIVRGQAGFMGGGSGVRPTAGTYARTAAYENTVWDTPGVHRAGPGQQRASTATSWPNPTTSRPSKVTATAYTSAGNTNSGPDGRPVVRSHTRTVPSPLPVTATGRRYTAPTSRPTGPEAASTSPSNSSGSAFTRNPGSTNRPSAPASTARSAAQGPFPGSLRPRPRQAPMPRS